MSTFFKALILFQIINLALSAKIIEHIDINSNIERLDEKKWDKEFVQYRLIDNIPYQYDKKNKKYFFNGLFGFYFLKNYIERYTQTQNKKYLEYSNILINALLSKSEKLKYNDLEAVVFYYEPNIYASRLFERHYSALTQAFYVEYLAKLYKITKNNFYKQLSINFFNSLLIPVEKGGVLFDKEGYTVLEETPLYPNQFILNGWLAAITSLSEANEILKNDSISNLISKNISTLNLLIDKYDVDSLNNSRYCLTQFFWFRILQKNYEIKSIKFLYPLNQSIEINATENIEDKGKSRWQTFVKGNNFDISSGNIIGKNKFQFNGILSNIDSNKIIIEYVNKIKKDDINFQIYLGEYDAMTSGPINSKWETIDKNFYEINNNKLTINIKHSKLHEILGYPTNFLKKFSDGNRNAYHDIHINYLNYLGDKYNSKKLKFYAKKWLNYRKNWESQEPYKTFFKNRKVIIDNKYLIYK